MASNYGESSLNTLPLRQCGFLAPERQYGTRCPEPALD
jgi:hypothetical protein